MLYLERLAVCYTKKVSSTLYIRRKQLTVNSTMEAISRDVNSTMEAISRDVNVLLFFLTNASFFLSPENGSFCF